MPDFGKQESGWFNASPWAGGSPVLIQCDTDTVNLSALWFEGLPSCLQCGLTSSATAASVTVNWYWSDM